ncbi:MAG: hypothetical protein IPO27_13460 [Bacteroidetes bacterium]|nr:hypothetical protein [Bacteroidota bacterium]
MSLKRLLLLTDYTLASNLAACHCYQIASLCKAEVISLHGINSTEDSEWAEKKSVEQITNIANFDKNISFKPVVSTLNLIQGLKDWLKNKSVDLTFMATHGKKDLQFITGSNALKLIFNAETPTVVVQHNTPLRPYKNILLPIFSHEAELQAPLSTLQAIISLFGSKLTIIIPATKDDHEEKEMQKKVDTIKNVLKIDNAHLELRRTDQPTKKFGKELLSVASHEKFDLIALMIDTKHHRKEAEKRKKIFQELITNENGIPVLCI